MRTPTNKVQTHHMATHRGHLKADGLALKTAVVFMH